MQSISALVRLLLVTTDTYRLRAQLLPAGLAVLPLFGVLLGEHRVDPGKTLLPAVLFMSVGGTWFLGQVIHACGQKRLRQLFRSRGGRPAIRMLRHRDRTVDRMTKQTWHERLSGQWGIHFPTRAEEDLDPAGADATYQRAVACCERHTWNRIAFPALRQESIECEFLMNGLALRWMGLITAAAAVMWTCVAHSSVSIGLRPRLELAASVSLNLESASIVLVSVLMALAWLFFFTPDRARSAAGSYDLHLLESGVTNIENARNHLDTSSIRDTVI